MVLQLVLHNNTLEDLMQSSVLQGASNRVVVGEVDLACREGLCSRSLNLFMAHCRLHITT